MTAFALAFAHLRDRAFETATHAALLALGVATVTLSLLTAETLEDGLVEGGAGVDLVAGAAGSPLQLILSSVYHVDVPIGNVPGALVAALEKERAVAAAIPLALGDSVRGVRLVGAPPAYAELYGARLAQGRFYETAGELVLGATAAERLGLALGDKVAAGHGLGEGAGVHEGSTLTLVGVLAPVGGVLDRLALTPLESVWAAHGVGPAQDDHDQDHDHDHDDHAHEDGDHAHEDGDHDHDRGAPGEVTAILIRAASPIAAVTLPDRIEAAWPGVQVASPARETVRVLSLVAPAFAVVRAVAAAILLGAGLSVFASLYMAMRTRLADAALLRALGAGRGVVTGQILIEGAATAFSGGVLGLLVAHGTMGALAAFSPEAAAMGVTAFAFNLAEIGILAGATALGALAAALPALSAYGVDVSGALRKGS